jgi:transposase InsO family protein
MRSKPVASLLVDLDINKSHSRPYTSDDNPYSEAQFKTLKYPPDFPERFGSIEDARAHCQTSHRRLGINPAQKKAPENEIPTATLHPAQ